MCSEPRSVRWAAGCLGVIAGLSLAVASLAQLPEGASRPSGDYVGPIQTAAFSPAGKTVATGALTGEVGVWDVATGKMLRVLGRHNQIVSCLAFHPGGQILASGSFDQTVKLWDVARGGEVRTLSGHKQWVTRLAFSPDGGLLASASADKTARLWDPTTGREVHTLVGHSNNVSALAFSPDGKVLASGSWDGTVKLWDTQTGAETPKFTVKTGGVRVLAFSSDGATLASASADETVRFWDLATGKLLRRVKPETQEPGKWLASNRELTVFASAVLSFPTGSDQPRLEDASWVTLWDVGSGQALRPLQGHGYLVTDGAFSADGTLFVSASADGTAIVWDVATGKDLHTFGQRNVDAR